MAPYSLYQRLLRADVDFLTAVAAGPAAVESFDVSWTALRDDVAQAIQTSQIDDATISLSRDVALRIALLSESLIKLYTNADTIWESMVNDVEIVMSKLTISDTPPRRSSAQRSKASRTGSRSVSSGAHSSTCGGSPTPSLTWTTSGESDGDVPSSISRRNLKRTSREGDDDDDDDDDDGMACTKGKRSRLSNDSSMRPHAGFNEPLPAETRNVTSRSEAPGRGKHYRFVDCSVPNPHTRKRQLATADDAPAHKRPRVEDLSNRAGADPVATSAATIEENLTQIGIPESNLSSLAIAQWAEIGFRLDTQVLSDCVSSSNPVSLDAPPVDVVNTLNIDSIASPGPMVDSSALSSASLMALTIASTPRQHSASLFSSPRASSLSSPEPDIPALCRSPESESSYDSCSILSSPRTRISEVRPHQPTTKSNDVLLREQWDVTRDVLYARYRERGLIDLSPASEDTFSYAVPPASLMSGISSIMQEHR